MKKHVARTALAAAVVVVMSVCFASQAFAWGSATHAYISDNLSRGDRNSLQKVYGDMAGDVFAYASGYNAEAMKVLYWATHYDLPLYGQELPSFIDVWEKSKTVLGRAVAFGFVTHNGRMGADLTAHGSYDYTTPDGFIIQKARSMGDAVAEKLFFIEMPAVYELCHIFIEAAVDIKIAENNSSLGKKMVAAAIARSSEFQTILSETYAGLVAGLEDLNPNDAKLKVRKDESDFRSLMISYGNALSQANAMQLVAEYLAALAPVFLAANGVDLPPGLDLAELSSDLLLLAYQGYTEGYAEAVQATIPMVRKNLRGEGIEF